MASLTTGLRGSSQPGQQSPLTRLLLADQITPGDDASYELCKTIYLYHPLGAKMAEAPIKQAQAQAREIAIPNSPEDRIVEAFRDEWDRMGCDELIAQVASTARIYGIASIVYGAPNVRTTDDIDPWELPDLKVYFNVLDPLNSAGSLVLNQDPNSPDYQKWLTVTAAGQPYARSRTCVLMNERPVYIAYTSSAFGFSGRSVYQRALYPLKSFIQTMITDDMVAQKAGLLVIKQKQAGSITDRLMAGFSAIKRQMLQGGRTNNVISVGHEDEVETLNMMNLDGAAGFARTNILKNIATAADMPAVMLENETLAEGFGEGTEDAKIIAGYVDGIRKWLRPLYDYFDEIVQHRAWNKDFYATIQAEFPDYKKIDHRTAFYQWKNAFRAEWPNLLKEPDSELVKVDEVRLKAIVSMVQTAAPMLDPENKARLFKWVQDNINELELMFPDPLDLDLEALAQYEPPEVEVAEGARAPSLKLAG